MNERTPPIPLSHKTRPEVARRRITAFAKRFGEPHLYLAYHAAFPLALTPDLLYRLWAAFQRDMRSEPLNIPWMAVADLLLSSLCHEVDNELYEMDTVVREMLLKDAIHIVPNMGMPRINELSHFLLAYIGQYLNSPDVDIRDYARTQQWVALAYLRPGEADQELKGALDLSVKQGDKADLMRMASLIETLAEPLAEFTPLLAYARSAAHFAQGDIKGAAAQLQGVAEEHDPLAQLLLPDLRTSREKRVAQRRSKLQRTLFIGLGGAGNEVIRRVKQEMLRHNYDVPIFQYLVLDTVPFHETADMPEQRRLRNGEEYLYIGGYNPNEILEHLDSWPTIAQWWGTLDQTNLVTVDEGTGQMRSVGRMGFFRHFASIQAHLERMVKEVMSNSNREQAMRQHYEVPSSKPPIVYIVFSLCGGTGSSLFFDVAYVLRKLFDVKPTIVSMAVMPSLYIQEISSTPQRERIQANTYAALQELEFLHSIALGQTPRPNGKDIWDVQYATNFRVSSPDLPFDYIYLIDDTTTNGEHFKREQIFTKISQAIFWLSGSSIGMQFWERAKNLSTNTIASGGLRDAYGQLRLPKYSALGITSITRDELGGLDRQIPLLEQLLGEDAWGQREMFLHGSECLLSFGRDTSQETFSYMESINIVGYGVASDGQQESDLRTQLQEMFKLQTMHPEYVQTDIEDELVYIKTLHGIPVSVIRSILEMQHSYQVLDTVRAAPYLHLDYRDQVQAGYGPLSSDPMTAQEIIDSWVQAITTIDIGTPDASTYIRHALNRYRLAMQSQLNEIVQVKDEHDPLFELIVDLEQVLMRQNRTPDISELLTRWSYLVGLLSAQRWVMINPAYGEVFDDKLHDLVQVRFVSGLPHSRVLEVIGRGYFRKRPNMPIQARKAKVVVSAGALREATSLPSLPSPKITRPLPPLVDP